MVLYSKHPRSRFFFFSTWPSSAPSPPEPRKKEGGVGAHIGNMLDRSTDGNFDAERRLKGRGEEGIISKPSDGSPPLDACEVPKLLLIVISNLSL